MKILNLAVCSDIWTRHRGQDVGQHWLDLQALWLYHFESRLTEVDVKAGGLDDLYVYNRMSAFPRNTGYQNLTCIATASEIMPEDELE